MNKIQKSQTSRDLQQKIQTFLAKKNVSEFGALQKSSNLLDHLEICCKMSIWLQK
jgi:hypothetical protein